MAKLEDFYPFVEPYAPGVSEILMDRALRDAMDEFCRDSRAIREQGDPITLVPGQTLYDVDPASSAVDVCDVCEVFVENSGYLGKVKSRIDPPNQTPGQVSEFYNLSSNTITVSPPPVAAGTAHILIATKPRSTAEVFDDRLLREWRTGIAAGALARIAMTPGLPASSAQAAQQYDAIFRGEIQKAAQRAMLGGIRATLRTTPIR